MEGESENCTEKEGESMKRIPKYLEAMYEASAQYSVEEICETLGIKWDDVEEYHIKWTTLFLRMKDGKMLETEAMYEPQMDLKRPVCIQELDKDYMLLEEA